MAVKINLKDGTGSKTANFKQEKTPATQGNVINTLDAYNEKIKKEYYDKNQARADENSLQSSIQNIVKLLAKNAWKDDVTLKENTNSEDTENDRLESYLANFNEDIGKTFDEAGLVRKINVIANILSGNTENSKQWKEDVHGNNAGAGESTLNVPVIGITRKDPEYTVEFKTESNERVLEISGLNDIKIERPNGQEDTINASEITVLSEKQVALMISSSIKHVLGGFDSQIANITAYLLFQEGELPDSYKFVLRNTNDEGIKSAPLFITYEDSDSNISSTDTQALPAYYVHDLNGDTGNIEPADYIINESNIDSLISDAGWKPTNSLFTLRADENLERVNVYYKNSEDANRPIYSLSVPKKTLTLNLHENVPAEGTSISYSCKVFDRVIKQGNFVFNNGIASENFPQGSTVTITKPTGFVDMLFCEEDYNETTDATIIDLSKEDAHVYNKKLTFIYKDTEIKTVIGYYSSSFSFRKKLIYPGYEATNETVFGVDEINNNWLSIANEKIKEKISDNTDEFTFDCNITWKNRQVEVILTHEENGKSQEKITEKTTLATGQEIPSITVEGYDFNGWQDSEGKFYTTVPFADITTLKLTAIQVLKTYNFIYDLNGGSWESDGDRSTHSHVFTKTDSDLIPTNVSRPGYEFVSWYRRPELENDIYRVEHFVNEDCTLYAKWEEKSYTINFELNSHEQLKAGANPMFKYQSLTIKASNLPITLGQAYATGYEFKGWAKTGALSSEANEANNLESYTGIYQIDISDFDTVNTINLSAVWKAINVPVIEEYYYEVEGQTGKYDLLETSKKEATVGTIYVKDGDYLANVGFEEKKQGDFTVMPTGNIYKRYFDRASFTVTYRGVGSEDKVQYTYSDNAQELKSVDNKLFDCWLKVETDENGNVTNKTPIKQISAYHFANMTLEARYNQNAPVLDKDFTVTTDFDKITIRAVSASGKIFVNSSESEQPKEITSSTPVVFDYKIVYPDNVTTTKSCFVYFEGNEDTNRNPSDQVEVPLIYNNKPPVIDQDYVLNSATSTVVKKVDGLEYRIGSSTKYLDLTSDLTIGRTDTIYIRRKETFSRFASDEVSGSFTGKQAAATNALILENFTVEDVSYKAQGSIVIAAAVFQGNHGALQYQTGSGNAWLDVNRTESNTSPTTLYVDKPCIVSFRYNESDEYLASSQTVKVPVGIKTHTVTFDISDINCSTFNFEGLDKVEGLNKFTLAVPSGSQLCKVENYIKNVNNWTITGYTKNIDSSLGRAVSFLKKEDGSQYNEASIIDDDITLRMNWTAAKFDVTYTDAVLLDGTELSLPSELLENYKKTFYYGQDVVIDLINNLTSLANYESTLVSILDNLDKKTNKILSFKSIYYKTGNSSYTDTGAEVSENTAKLSFKYFGENGTPNFGATLESFPYKFASKFDFVESTAENAKNAVIQFNNGIDSGTAIGTVKEVSYYGGTGSENFKFVYGSNNQLDIYYANDPRATSYNTLNNFTATENSVGNGCTLTVTFHSAYIKGNFYPRKVVEGVIAIRSTVTDQSQIYNIYVDGDGITSITPINDWTIEADPVYSTTNSN